MHAQYGPNDRWISIFTLTLLALLLVATSSIAAESAPERPLEKITIAYSSLSANMAPLWVTHERGLFRKYGLDAQLVFIESGSTTVESLVSKNVSFAQMAGAGVLQSRLRGSDVVMIAGVINTLTFKFYVDKSIKQPDQLKGKTVAVTRSGSSTDFALRYALEKYGLRPEKDVAILEAGNMPAMIASLQSGKIHGAILSSPFTLRAKNMGFPLLADLQMLGLEYQHTGLATTMALIKSRPDLVRNTMKAYVEGIHYYKTHRAESLAILARYLKTSDAEVLTEIYEDIGLRLTAEKPFPTLRGIGIMLRELSATNPKAAAARPEEFVDSTFIKELTSSGFIDRLYKTTPVVAKRDDERSVSGPAVVKEKSGIAGEKTKAATAAVNAPAPALGEGSREHIVIAGDTLSHIALAYYGTSHKWENIYLANKTTMKNPHYLYIGQKILIPS
jgi:NitT/TauT family transport system substrate-binding protein